MGTSQERRPCRESNATWTGPLSEAMPACRGRRADHAQKDRVGTWEVPRSARAIPLLVRIGKGEPKADDERTREVGPSSSSVAVGLVDLVVQLPLADAACGEDQSVEKSRGFRTARALATLFIQRPTELGPKWVVCLHNR